MWSIHKKYGTIAASIIPAGICIVCRYLWRRGTGYDDNHEIIEQLNPLNPYGISKNEFDKWVLHQEDHPPFWAGLKFFNVYGPNEYHKARMASVIFHSFNQIKKTGKVKLFRSHKEGYKDGEQLLILFM